MLVFIHTEYTSQQQIQSIGLERHLLACQLVFIVLYHPDNLFSFRLCHQLLNTLPESGIEFFGINGIVLCFQRQYRQHQQQDRNATPEHLFPSD